MKYFHHLLLLLNLLSATSAISQQQTTKDYYLPSSIIYNSEQNYFFNGASNELVYQSSEELQFEKGYLIEKLIVTTNPSFKTEIVFNYVNSKLQSQLQKVTSDFGYTEDHINYEYDSINSIVTIKKGYGISPKKITQKLYYQNQNNPTYIETFDDFDDFITLKEEFHPNFSKKKYYNALGQHIGTIVQLFANYRLIKTITPTKIGRKTLFDHEIYQYDSYGNLEQIDHYTLKNKQVYWSGLTVNTISKFSNYLDKTYWVIQIDRALNEDKTGFYVTVRTLKDSNNVTYNVAHESTILNFCKKIYNDLKQH